MLLRLSAPFVLAFLSVLAIAPAQAQETPEQFFRGKTVNIYVGSPAGGGYDTYGRLVARHLGAHIPGRPTIVVQNMPGAGSNKAASYIYAVAPKDGTAIGAIFPGAVLQPLLGDTPVQHEPAKFIYIGSANSEVYHCVVRADAPAKTFREAQQKEIVAGASREGGTTRDLPVMLNNLAGAKFKVVTGYAGSREIGIAMERNEVHASCGVGWAGFETTYPHWFEQKMVTMMLQLAVKGHPTLDKWGVPLATEFATSTENRQAMDLVLAQGLFGRPYVLPPGVPADRADALRKAFATAMADPALLADATKLRLDIDMLGGEELQKKVADLYALPVAVVEKAKQSLIYKPAR